ncbi:hypothetical protein HHI36_008004 [Cryptolaemus montrouzieri]|uniref:Uncharacterized protein n=1 Tax=Cryptolaemus montrouzieri TaxID=559131 RepID=A0ABD2MRR6_9CUCU
MQHFREFSWDIVLREADVSRAYDAFNGVIRSRMDLIFPEKTRPKRSSVTVASITRGNRVSCKKNKRVLYEGVRSGWVSDEYYKKYVKIFKQVIEQYYTYIFILFVLDIGINVYKFLYVTRSTPNGYILIQ